MRKKIINGNIFAINYYLIREQQKNGHWKYIQNENSIQFGCGARF